MVSRACPICQKTYEADEGRLKFGRQTTCSRACSYELRVSERRNATLIACATCGKEVSKTTVQLGRVKNGVVFCSRSCHYAGRKAGIAPQAPHKTHVYSPEGRAAMIAASSRPKGRRVHHWLTCAQCSAVFDDRSSGRQRKSGKAFCSLTCCNTFRKGIYNPSWRGGHPKYYGPDWRAQRRAAWQRDKYTCRRCGKTRKDMGRRPDVHHIKPVGSFPTRNDAHTLDNLVSLCHGCHQQVEWHGIDFSI